LEERRDEVGSVAVGQELSVNIVDGAVIRKKSRRSEFSATFHAATFSNRYS
jgi:hypothetical protein